MSGKAAYELEALESRILLSADGLGAGLPDDVSSDSSPDQMVVKSHQLGEIGSAGREVSYDPVSQVDDLFDSLGDGVDGELQDDAELEAVERVSDAEVTVVAEEFFGESDQDVGDLDSSTVESGEGMGDFEAPITGGTNPDGGVLEDADFSSGGVDSTAMDLGNGNSPANDFTDPTNFEATRLEGQADLLSRELVDTLRAANGPPASEQLIENQPLTDLDTLASADTESGSGFFASTALTVKAGALNLETVSNYLGYEARKAEDGGLMIFSAGEIQLWDLRPGFLAAQGIHSLTIQGSDLSDDNLVVDLRQGEVPLEIIYHGGEGGFDTLEVLGVEEGGYTPGAVFGDGVVHAGSTQIHFTGLEPVIVTGVDAIGGTFTFTTPGGADLLTIDSPAPGQNRISGTSDGVAFENITFSGIAHFVIDTAANDSAGSDRDEIVFDSPLVATGLLDLTLRTGAGDELIDLSSTDPSGAPGILIESGSGNLEVRNTLEGEINRVLFSLSHSGFGVPQTSTFSGIGDVTMGTGNQLVMHGVTLNISDLSYALGSWSGNVEVTSASATLKVGASRTVSIGVGGPVDPLDPNVTPERVAMETLAVRQVFALSGANFVFPEPGQLILGSVSDPTEIGWVDWLQVETTALSISWTSFLGSSRTNLTFSANVLGFKLPDFFGSAVAELAVNALAKLQGTVGGVTVDLDLLQQDKFAVTAIGSVSVGVALTIPLFGAAEGALVLGIAKVDVDGNLIDETDEVTPVDSRFAYGAILGKVLDGKSKKLKVLELKGDRGGAFRIGLSELGPLTLYLEIFEPMVIHPPSGLTLTGFRGGISFSNPLPSITNPEDLRGKSFEPTKQQDIIEWTATLKQQVANQLKLAQSNDNYTWSNFVDLGDPNAALRIEGGATMFLQKVPSAVLNADVDFIFSTDGKLLLSAKVNALAVIHFSAFLYIDFSDLANGSAAILFLADLPEQIGGISPLITLKGALLLEGTASNGQPVTDANLADGLLLTLTGSVDVNVPGLDPISLEGTVDLTFVGDTMKLTVHPGSTAQISVFGLVQSIPMGSAEFTIADLSTPNPVIWGYATITASDFSGFLPQGVTVSGTALLKLNTSGTDRTVNVLRPGGAPSIPLALPKNSLGFFLDGSVGYEPIPGQTLLQMQGIFLMEVSGSGLKVLAQNVVMTVGPPSASFLTLRGNAFLVMSASGMAARMYMNLETNFPAALGIHLSASFDIVFNSTSSDVSITVPTSISGGGADLTVTVPRGPPPSGGTVGASTWSPSQSQPYLLIQADGTLTVLNTIALVGKFDFLASTTTLSVAVDAGLGFGPFQFRARGGMLIDSARFAGVVSLAVENGLPSNLGITFGSGMTFELGINTGGATTVAGVPLATGEIRVKAGGEISVPGLALQGTYIYTLGVGQLTVAISATTSVFGVTLGVNGLAGLYYDSNPGMAFRIQLTLGGGPDVVVQPVAGVFTISANFELVINTSNAERAGIAARTFEIGATKVSVNLFGFTLAGDLVISISSGGFSIPSFDLVLDFFGAFELNVSGAFSTSGTFSFTASRSIEFLDPDVFGFEGTVSVTFTNSGFSGSVDAKFGAFGIKVGGKGNFTIEAGLVKLAVHISFQITPELNFTIPMPWPLDNIDIHVPALIISGTWRNTFGALTSAPVVPPPPALATRVGSALRLNIGADVGHRGADYPATDESYNLALVGAGSSFGQKIKVSALGYDQIYDNVTNIVANNTGSGTVFISVAPDITVPISINAGVSVDGENHFILGGGPATVQGGSNYDWIDAGSGGGTFYGGTGNGQVIDDHGNLSVRVSGYDSYTISDKSLLYSSGGGAAKNINLGGSEGVGNVTLTGSPNAAFTVTPGWTGDSLSLNGAGGSSVTATTANSYTLTNSALTSGAGQVVNLSGVSTASLSGSGTFTVSGWTGAGASAINGFGGADRVVAVNDANFGLTNTSLTRSSGGPFTLTGVEEATLTGGVGANHFAVSNWAGTARLDGAGAGDVYTVDAVGSGSGTVFINDSGGTGGDTLTVNGTSLADPFAISESQVVRGSEAVHYADVDFLAVHGHAGNDVLIVDGTSIPASFTGGDQDDQFHVRALGADAEVQTGAGSNSVHVGSTANRVDGVNGKLSVVGGGADTLNVNDFGDTGPNDGVLTSSRLTGLGMAGGSASKGIAYSSIEALNVHLGSGADRLAIQSTSASTTVRTGGGDDTVNVGSAATVASNAGGSLNGLAGLLTVDGQGGSGDVIHLDDTSDAQSNTGELSSTFLSGLGTAGISYTGLEAFLLNLGSGNDVFTVQSTHAGSTHLEMRGGNDQVLVRSISGLTEIAGQDGTDTFTVGNDTLGAFSTVNGIQGLLRLTGGTQQTGESDTLLVSEVNEVAAASRAGSLSSSLIAGLGMDPSGSIDYSEFEALEVILGQGDDPFAIASTHAGLTTVRTGAGNDVVNLATIGGETRVRSEAGDDLIRVNVNADGTERLVGGVTANGVGGLLDLDGQTGSDSYRVYFAGSPFSASHPESLINVRDTGGNGQGTDFLEIFGTDDPVTTDNFLVRRNFIALVPAVSGGGTATAERVDYDDSINAGIAIYARAGDDYFAFDDTSASMTVDGGDGSDTFQIGQMFQSERVSDLILLADSTTAPGGTVAPGDEVRTIHTTRGYLTPGVQAPTTIYGGDGEDQFIIFSNQGPLGLFGEDGDDRFVVRAFALYGSQAIDPNREGTNINAGQGADNVEYSVNAPVAIDGGDGRDTIVVVGTEFSDKIVVTSLGIYGAGLYITYIGIEEIEVHAAEGNDHISVLSTPLGVVTRLFGDLGSDTFDVGGQAGAVVSRDLQGHSGLIDNLIVSDDLSYNAIPAEGVSVDVADNDEPGVVITESGGSTTVAEFDFGIGLTIDTYTVVLTRPPVDDQDVYLTISAPVSSLKDQSVGSSSVQVSTQAPNAPAAYQTPSRAIELRFTAQNWSQPQTVEVHAVDDAAPEGTRFAFVQHSISKSSAQGYGGLAMPNVAVKIIDDDQTSAVLLPLDGSSLAAERIGTVNPILEGNTGVSSQSFALLLTKGAGTVSVDGGAQLTVLGNDSFSFAPGGPAQLVTLRALDDGVVEGPHRGLVRATVIGNSSAEPDQLEVSVADTNSPGVVILPTDGSTRAIEGSGVGRPWTDSYSVVLTQAPAVGTSVDVQVIALPTPTTNGQILGLEGGIQSQVMVNQALLTFTSDNWSAPQVVQVTALDDAVVDGGDIQVFARTLNSLDGIRGPVLVEGGIDPTFDSRLPDPRLYLRETNLQQHIDLPNPNFSVLEPDQIDVLRLNNQDAVATQSGRLTQSRISGLGMGSDLTVFSSALNQWVTFGGGVTYSNLETVALYLGRGADTFEVENTHSGETLIDAGSGHDEIKVEAVMGYTRILGGTGNDRIDLGDSTTTAATLDRLQALVTVDGGEGFDTVNLRDQEDGNDNVVIIDQETVSGLDMHETRVLTLEVSAAAAGTFNLTLDGHTALGLSIKATAAELRSVLAGFDLPGVNGIAVDRSGELFTMVFSVDESVPANALQLSAGGAVVSTGTSIPNRVQSLTLPATTGSHEVSLGQDPSAPSFFIHPDDDAAAVRAKIIHALNPTNKASTEPGGYGRKDVVVTRNGTTYEVLFQGLLSGDRGVPFTFSVAPRSVATATTFSLNVIGGTFRLNLAGSTLQTSPLPWDASAIDVETVLRGILDSQTLTVSQVGSTFTINDSPVNLSGVDDRNLVAPIAVAEHAAGVNYYQVDLLNVYLGTGADIVNIRGTTALTNVFAGEGDDRLYVSSLASETLASAVTTEMLAGHLDRLQGTLNLDSGEGRHALMISDEAAVVGDGTLANPVRITDQPLGHPVPATAEIAITGLAPAPALTYRASATGNFVDGIRLWTGWGSDVILIDGTHERQGNSLRTATMLNTGLGDDHVTVGLDTQDGFFALNTQGPEQDYVNLLSDRDVVDGSQSTRPLLVFGGQDEDDLSGGSSADVIFGDRGRITYLDGATPVAVFGNGGPGDRTDGIERPLGWVTTTDPGVGGGDTIQGGNGNNVILGGADGDDLRAGTGDDLLVGDHGVATFTLGVLTLVETSEPELGGSDVIDSDDGHNVIFGGTHGDVITGGSHVDYVVGDQGHATFTDSGVLTYFTSVDPALGGGDTIEVGNGSNLVIGGFGHDVIGAGDDRDLVLGDNGNVTFTEDGELSLIQSSDAELAGDYDDTIFGFGGDNLVIAGNGDDAVTTGSGMDIVLGDNGFVDLIGDGDPADIDRIASTEFGIGGADKIATNGGSDVVLGGYNDDAIDAGDGNNVVIGDSGLITSAPGAPVTAMQGGVLLTIGRIETVAPGEGGSDTIATGAGNDVILGGIGGDTAHAGDGSDVLVGDNGFLAYVTESDSNAATLDRVSTTHPELGGADTLFGNGGNDLIIGGAHGDILYGDNGNGLALGADGNDLIFGDQGLLQGVVDANEIGVPNPSFTYAAKDTTNDEAGGDDFIDSGDGRNIGGWNENGTNILMGQQGSDRLFGGAGDEIIYGGHGHNDEGSSGAVRFGHDGGDFIDGKGGDDLIIAFNAKVNWRADSLSPRFRSLEGSLIYDPSDDSVLVSDPARANPGGELERDLLLYGMLAPGEPVVSDVIAGGSGDDMIFGHLGNDQLHGDGRLDVANGDALASALDTATDGQDYVEGGAGEDTIFGGLGQDDLIGGSSNLFGYDHPSHRADGSDTIFGGNGDMAARNHLGIEGLGGHGRDADVILGDNGNIFRLVSVAPSGLANQSAYLSFNYDAAYGERLIPRAADLLDYTPGGADHTADPDDDLAGIVAGDLGAGDVIRGESGDDAIYGMAGDDFLFGDGQDDDLIGGYGQDWISGGTGVDGVLGDDGRIYTSRNVERRNNGDRELSEPLYGIAKVDEVNQTISTPGNLQVSLINVEGALKKTVNLTPFNLDPGISGAQDPLYDARADDVIYGGWGGDFLHGGAGDDAISGAEALPLFYDAPANPGNLLGYDSDTGEFAAYDELDPLRKIVNEAGNPFLLNFDASEGVAVGALGGGEAVFSDGDDVLFGDLGNDWLVGGTGRDHLYGGYGNDLLNADDNHDSTVGSGDPAANNVTDTHASYEDVAFGGAGRDILIGNTGGDRLIDLSGEFNSYLVPFAPFGGFTISRAISPGIKAYLYDLSEADGADPTRAADTGSDPARHGEPQGEIGLVDQGDPDWGSQTGSPGDPQPGNIGGGAKDVLRTSDVTGAGGGGKGKK